MQIFAWNQPLGRPECPYMHRWVFNFFLFSIRIHHWHASDDHRFWHDHSWWFITLVLSGSYTDVSAAGRDLLTKWSMRFRKADHSHTTEVSPGGCWTLLFTGPELYKWGFWVNGKFNRPEKYFKKYGTHPCNT